MEQQIQNLQKSVQELVEYKIQEEEAKEKYNQWKQEITNQLVVFGKNVKETKKDRLHCNKI